MGRKSMFLCAVLGIVLSLCACSTDSEISTSKPEQQSNMTETKTTTSESNEQPPSTTFLGVLNNIFTLVE